jgi:hypothetical protein
VSGTRVSLGHDRENSNNCRDSWLVDKPQHYSMSHNIKIEDEDEALVGKK